MEDEKSDSEKLIEELIPKISEYFSQNKILTKSNIKQLVEFLEFPIIEESNETEIEEYWQEISTNSDEGNLTQELFITNLTQYINNHSKELFEQESISDDITKFLDKPVQLIEDIDKKLNEGYNFVDFFLTIGSNPSIFQNEWLYESDLSTLNTKYNLFMIACNHFNRKRSLLSVKIVYSSC